ncbi:hypothetical protein IAR55_003911 [Kwoniella newhampshirensis]|uniref:Uncharacterized protein n=1 Tax=Kwoniella newhampshirensis TaxID=1651941 RepID=A0AAW0YYF6_9TREE
MSLNHHLPKKISLAPKKHHGFQFVLFLLGFVLPPLAVAVRFGIGKDFFINTFLCICGYIPCHFHNFYIQNIRNNQNRARTPKWAIRYGLVDDTDRQRRLKKSQWSKRYDERNNHSTLADQPLEEGEEGPNYDPSIAEDPAEVERRRNEGLWTNQDEEYYNADQAPNQQKWHYPANFEGTVGDGRSKRNGNASAGGDRWQRAAQRSNTISSNSSGNTYPPAAATDQDVPEWGKDYGSKRRSSKRTKSSTKKGHEWANNAEYGYSNGNGSGSQEAFGSNEGRRTGTGNGSAAPVKSSGGNGDPNWDHEF